jgi:hypothetical protein
VKGNFYSSSPFLLDWLKLINKITDTFEIQKKTNSGRDFFFGIDQMKHFSDQSFTPGWSDQQTLTNSMKWSTSLKNLLMITNFGKQTFQRTHFYKQIALSSSINWPDLQKFIQRVALRKSIFMIRIFSYKNQNMHSKLLISWNWSKD